VVVNYHRNSTISLNRFLILFQHLKGSKSIKNNTQMRFILIIFLIVLTITACETQQTIVVNYEDKPNTESWWRDNNQVQFLLDETKEHQQHASSKVCLNVRWDSIPANKPWCWFTDLKIDTLANPAMDKVRADFGENIWLSCWCNTGNGDTIYLQPLMLTRGHVGKWGAKQMTPVCSAEWRFYKFKLSALEYENWGKIPGSPNLKTNDIRCFELGIRTGQTSSKGFVDARFDELRLTNYEPFPNKK